MTLLPLAAHGQPADPANELDALLNTQVEGASRYPESALDAPAVVSVISRDTSVGLGHVTLAEMLERLPGTYVTTSRTYSAVGLRGFNRPGDYNARILMTIDGYRVNDALYDQALPEFEFPIIADWVKRLELINGPASSVYGGNALLGVANVVTVDGADEPGFGLKAGLDDAGGTRLTGQYGWSQGDVDVFVGLTHHQVAGETLHLPELASDSVPGGVVSGLDGLQYTSLLAKARRGPWRGTFVVQARDKDVATAEYGTVPGAAGTHYLDRYAYGELAYDGPWQGDWRLKARASLSRMGFEGDYVMPAEDDGGDYLNRDVADSRWAGFDARAQWRGWINHSLSAGVELRRVFRGLQRNEDVEPAATYLDRDDQSTQWGLYAQDQFRFSERTSLTVGLRADKVDTFDVEVSPRLALVHRPGPFEAVKLMLGRAFRAPNLSERYYEDGGLTQVANPTLRPERISTVELAWERSIGEATRLSLGGYAYRMDDLIDFVALDDEVSHYENVSSALLRGVDLDVEHREPGGWQWRASVSLADMSSKRAAAFNSPRWLFKGHLLGPLDSHWSIGLQWLAMARRDGLRADVASFVTADALLRRVLTPGQSVALIVRNVADSKTHDPASSNNDLLRVPRPRRSLTLEWQARF
ncbi:MAG TPA: TonB-dependent receptor [Ideonella sp.]|uniref:TonB-dependent receptor plug domain-containing protein n=1 Tax=Ideonella sp. TaxID=1929293 RepID=UPI002E323436|nr:TonB-dependent receptor [Ideonella sp.]HEX5688303.1 TonB-dependent receptor [Ideonella sp.]